MKKLNSYLLGEKLYGDDFDISEIKEWYRDEQEGYAELGAKDKGSYHYVYHALNMLHGFKYLKEKSYENVLGLGSAYGDEFIPIKNKITDLTILDPSDAFRNETVHGIPCTYVKPSIDGGLPFEDQSFDLIHSLGVLHHIPNVTAVVNELCRCLSSGGMALVREPIVSMGDWSRPRLGLTKRERGIPLDIFDKIIGDSEFTIIRKSLCVFPLVPRICNKIGIDAYNSHVITLVDAQLSKLFKWNIKYHPDSVFKKFMPSSVYYVLSKN